MRYTLFATAFLSSVLILSCAETPSTIGFENLGSGDTLVIRTLDTHTDAVAVTARHGVARTTTVTADVLLLGRADSTVAKSFLQFSFPDSLFDATVMSAILVMTPATYEAGDTAHRRLNFYSYKVVRAWGNNATWDTLGSASVLEAVPRDTFSVARYSGRMADTLHTAIVREWLVAAHDTLAPKNYGMALIPAPDASVAKAFFSQQAFGSEPKLIVTYQKPGRAVVTDSFQLARDLYVANSPYADSTTLPGDLIVEAGVGVRTSLKFDLSSLPALAQVNAVTLELTLKEKSLGYGAADGIAVYAGDTSVLFRTALSGYYFMTKKDSTSPLYSMSRVFTPTEQWVRMPSKNFGFLLEADPGLGELSTLKRYVFYGPNDPDPVKRPHVRITYSFSRRP